MRSVLFVCTANICRSPMALAVFRKLVGDEGAASRFELDSAGTHDFHVGSPAFPPVAALARSRGYDLTAFTARRIRDGDFDRFDHILAMDRSNIAALQVVAPTRCRQKIELLLAYGDRYEGREVPDPYGGKPAGYELALAMIEDGCRGLADLLLRES